jgi:Txe/YoeB family toxin of Txe-Axe toxin-antitoxin module
MSRPTKQGIDYFPLDVQFDEKIELLIAEVGSDALSTLISIWQLVYQNNGYYVDNGKDLFLLIRRRIMLDVSLIEEIIGICIERGIFDGKLHDEYNILTSKAIQKRYFIAASRKKVVNVIKNYLLVGVNEYNNLSLQQIDVCINSTKVEVEVDVEVDAEVVIAKSKAKKLPERITDFEDSVMDYNFKNKLYPDKMIEDFIEYWTEHGLNDKKARWEKEKSFGIGRRLSTWNSRNFDNKNNKPKQKSIYDDL